MAAPGKSRLFSPAFLQALERLRLSPRRAVDGRHRAELRSRQSGASLEFAEHRSYTFGDDPRSLDWNAYARLDRLFVKLFHDEEAMAVTVLLDGSESMRCAVTGSKERSRWDYGRLLAGAFAYVALAGQHEVLLGIFSETLGARLGPVRGRAKFHDVVEFLDRDDLPRGGTSLESSLRAVRGKRQMIVVISDFTDSPDFEGALKRLAHRGFDVAVIRVFDPAEDGRDLNGDLLVVDSETGEELAVSATDSGRNERARTNELVAAELRAFCHSNGMAFHNASCAVDATTVLVELERSGVLRR